MTDQITPDGQEPTTPTPQGQTPNGTPPAPTVFGADAPPAAPAESQDDDARDYEAEMAKLRAEAAKWRTKLRDAEGQLKEVQPLAEKYREAEEAEKSEAEKLRDRLSELEAKTAQAEARAARAQREATAARLAARAGVDPEIVALLDIDKLELDDEAAALAQLKKLAAVKPGGGGPSNPARTQASGPTEDELHAQYFQPAGSGLKKIFGG